MATLKRLKNIKELAALAGVSIGSASMVLNGKWHKKVNPEAAKRILEVAREYQYEASTLGRSLQLGRTMRIGIMMDGCFQAHPHIGAFSFHDMIAVFADTLSRHDYSISILQMDERKMADVREHRLFPGNHDAYVFLEWERQRLLELLETVMPEKPYVIVGDILEKNGYNVCWRDTEIAVCGAIRRWIEAGHREIAFIRTLGSEFRFQRKFTGFLRALTTAGIVFDPALLFQVRSPRESMGNGIKMAHELLNLKKLPTACFCDDNLDAVGLVFELQRCGIKLPEQMELISYGDSSLAELSPLKLSHLEIPGYKIVEVATDYLVNQIESAFRETDGTFYKLIPETYVKGETSLV